MTPVVRTRDAKQESKINSPPQMPYLVFRIISLLLVIMSLFCVVMSFLEGPEVIVPALGTGVLALLFWAIADIGLRAGRIEAILRGSDQRFSF